MADLTNKQLQGLLAPKAKTVAAPPVGGFVKHAIPAPIQKGPLRFVDTPALTCMGIDRGRCGSPTYIKVRGVPQCAQHALILLNRMLVERGVE